jgi:uncharacterized membrane protein
MQASSPTTRNIRAICDLEKQALLRRSISEVLGDIVAVRAGQMWFIVVHVIWFTAWMWLNSRYSPWPPFDAFPYSLLTMVVSLESIFLSLFILMSQNRSSLQADQRNHLDLQINLLAEDENTKLLQMVRALCKDRGLEIGDDPEIAELAQRTEPEQVLEDIKSSLPQTSGGAVPQ